MWKFQDFSVTQILREIDFGGSGNFKTACSATLETLNFVNLVNFSLQKVQKFIEIKIIASECVKMAEFALLCSKNLFSRKI